MRESPKSGEAGILCSSARPLGTLRGPPAVGWNVQTAGWPRSRPASGRAARSSPGARVSVPPPPPASPGREALCLLTARQRLNAKPKEKFAATTPHNVQKINHSYLRPADSSLSRCNHRAPREKLLLSS